MIPFTLAPNADGAVAATADLTKAMFVTNNTQTNEYRNCNFPQPMALGPSAIVLFYNIQENNTNNTTRWAQVFDRTGVTIMPQTKVFAQTNDDVCGGAAASSQHVQSWNGLTAIVTEDCLANGNGNDDNRLVMHRFTLDNMATPTKATWAKAGNVEIEAEEERTRGDFDSIAGQPNGVYGFANACNNQNPQHGNKLIAVDISNPDKPTVLWSKTLQNRKQVDIGNGQTVNTRAVRAQAQFLKVVNPTTGAIENSNRIIYQSLDVHQNGNNNGTKGGRIIQDNIAVLELSPTGYTEVIPFTNLAETQLMGFDSTHVTMLPALLGTSGSEQPGVVMVSGSHLGGGMSAEFHMLGVDVTNKTFVDHGNHSGAPYDRHLYSNYLGNNPGQQGRNYSGGELIANPFYGQGTTTAAKDKYLLVMATTGKDPSDAGNMMHQPSSYVTVMPITSDADASPDPQDPNNPAPGTGSNNGSNGSQDSGTTLGGCSAGGASGAGMLLLIGLAAFRRRR